MKRKINGNKIVEENKDNLALNGIIKCADIRIKRGLITVE